VAYKLRWFKWYGTDYLKDSINRGWGYREHGVFLIASCILWTETDEPGRYILKGKPGTMTDFARHIARFCSANRYSRTPTQVAVNVLRRCCEEAVMKTTKQGVIECPHILNQLELSKKRADAGKKRGDICSANSEVCSAQNRKERKSIKTLLLRSMYKRAEE